MAFIQSLFFPRKLVTELPFIVAKISKDNSNNITHIVRGWQTKHMEEMEWGRTFTFSKAAPYWRKNSVILQLCCL